MQIEISEKPAVAVPTSVEMSPHAYGVYKQKYSMDGLEEWPDTSLRVVSNVMNALNYGPEDLEYQKVLKYVTERKFIPGGRYLYSSGRALKQTQNCALYRAEDSREGWADLLHKVAMSLMTGAGVGVDYSAIRCNGSLLSRTGGTASGPLALMQMINETGRHVMSGGSRRAAIWAGLSWKHGDIFDFINCKNWSKELRELKLKDFTFPAPMEFTNISVILDREFFDAYDDPTHSLHAHAHKIYFETVKRMVKTGEPGFSIDYEDGTDSLRNACTEVTSSDDSDICNLGSINLSRIEDMTEMEDVVKYATLFLLAGTVYSDLPHAEIHVTREKNRRLGLGLMGVHEWLLAHGYRYEPSEELGEWLSIYAQSTEIAADWADLHGLSRPVKTRAIAPAGTIGIVGETTTGIEPIFAVAYKRRRLKGDNWVFEYVVDPAAHRQIEAGRATPQNIEDAYILGYDVERRIAFQAWIQQYVDMGISSTINMAHPIRKLDEVQQFADILYPYLPQLRGMTVYPDGARGGQPLSVTTYENAIKHHGVLFESEEDVCASGSCGV